MDSGTRVRNFRDAVRHRDRRCLITREEAEDEQGHWWGYEAAHIFPLAHQGYWQEHNFDRWITIPPETGGSISSIQNGLLLRSDLHQLFDVYNISINPDVCI
jgi:HNH endonuclease